MQNKTNATATSTCPTRRLSISFLEHTKPSLDSEVQNVAEVFHHLPRLGGGMLLQPEAHHLVEALCKLGNHSLHVAASDRQDVFSQEEPEHGQDVALDGVGFTGINRWHEHCRVRETTFLTT